MTKDQIYKHIKNSSVPISVKEDYKKELKIIKKKYGTPLHKCLLNGFKSLFPAAGIYLLVIFSCIFLKFFCENIEPLSNWLDENDFIADLVVIFWMILVVVGIVMTLKAFSFVFECFSDAFQNLGSDYRSKELEVIKKYNEIGYYPQYNNIADCIKLDGHCAYYDDYRDLFRCPIDDSSISNNRSNFRCFSSDYYTCNKCEKLQNIYSYFS